MYQKIGRTIKKESRADLTPCLPFNGDAHIRTTVLNGSIAFPNPVLAGYFPGSASTVLLEFIQSNLSEANSEPAAMLLLGTGPIGISGSSNFQ